jgi:F0F1-type ATP synthase alpha subunit
MDDVPLTKVNAFEKGLLEHFQGPAKAVRDQLSEKKSFKGLEEQFNAAIKAFKATFR